jgi:HK97 family phage major capsid protein
MTISELVNDLENQITNDRAAIEGILETARHSGRETLTRTEDLRAEAIFTRLEQNKRKLASALKVKADEDETDRKSADIRRNPSLPDNYQTRAHVTERTERIGRNGDNRPAHNADTWLRSADGTKATVDRGERFADHAVVRNELNRYAERDRHIIEAHGDFGQWLRAMDTSTQSAVVPTIWASQIVDLARNDAVVMQAGARTVPMSGKVEHVGRLTADAVAYWKGEGSPITPSDLTFDYVEFTAKSMGALCVASVEFMQDAPNAGELIQASIAKAQTSGNRSLIVVKSEAGWRAGR